MSKINKITPLTNVKFLNLYELEAENKFGNTHPYYVASRKDKNTMMAATKKVIPDGVVIYSLFGEKADKLIMVKQFRYPNRIETLEIPAGKLEANENPKDCAFRELEEETNNRAREMKFIMKVLPSPGYTSEWLYLYEAIDFEEVDDALEGDEDEFIDIIKLDIDEAYQKVLSGEIVDAKTVIAIMYAYQQVHH